MLRKLALSALFVVIGLQLLLFPAIEAFAWNTDFGRGVTHLTEPEAAATAGVGRNMALYNAFFGLILAWVTAALPARQANSAQSFLLGLIAVAGVFGWITMGSGSIAVLQSLPALAALALVWAARPYPREEGAAIREIVAIERQALAITTVEEPPLRGIGGGGVPRGQHPKMHGLLRAEFTVATDVPESMRVGLFAGAGRTYRAYVRYSTARGTDDQEAGAHGMAIKLMGVDGPEGTTQDFVLLDCPVFFLANPLQYVEFEEALLRSRGKSGLGTALMLLLHYFWRHPNHLKNLKRAARSDVTDPLAVRYWSVTPYRLGDRPVKYTVRPSGDAAAVTRSADMFKAAIKAHLAAGDAEFAFQVQAQADPATMPVDDPTREWDEAASVPQTVARLRIPAGQDFDTEENRRLAEHLSFTPWHALPEHAPLGGLNLARKAVYDSLSEFRHALNHDVRSEPKG